MYLVWDPPCCVTALYDEHIAIAWPVGDDHNNIVIDAVTCIVKQDWLKQSIMR